MNRAVLFLSLLSACSIGDPPGRSCDEATPCPAGQDCYRGFCVATSDGSTRDAGVDAPAPCAGDETRTCFEGPVVDGRVVGICRAGQQMCVGGVYSRCLGQVLPQEEVCNGLDDDCNGMTDDLPPSSCNTRMPGACAEGTFACQDGTRRCVALSSPVDEIACNGVDDDCDGSTDEFDAPECYPDGTLGCPAGGACVGACRRGTRRCDGEGAPVCDGAVTPQADDSSACDGIDNDCDGSIDEECSCSAGDSQACYSGPAATAGLGACRAGTQTCDAIANRWGACTGERLPNDETCANAGTDDDCDGTVDENVGGACDTGMPGVCAAGIRRCVDGSEQCVPSETPSAETCNERDDDCDGTVDEGFNVTSDPMNCGSCGITCSGSRSACCNGACVDIRGAVNHCGACGVSCAAGEICCNGACKTPAECAGCEGGCAEGQTCCGGVCVDVRTDENHCGGCNMPCGPAQVCCGSTCIADSDPSACGESCAPCGTNELCCDGSCVPRDVDHCASCASGCAAGECCPDIGMCIDTNSDPEHCGGCGLRCPSGMGCAGGECCTMCGSECVDLQTDPNHCGACNNRCSVVLGLFTGECRSGACQ